MMFLSGIFSYFDDFDQLATIFTVTMTRYQIHMYSHLVSYAWCKCRSVGQITYSRFFSQ